jgi:hypothetical protein
VVDIEELRKRLVGRPFPGGPFVVAPYERWLAHDAMQCNEVSSDLLHPVWVFLCGLRGMGMGLDDLLRIAEADLEAGVVWGETALEQCGPLRADTPYEIRGEIIDLTRHSGQRAGTFDTLTFRLDVLDAHGNRAGSSTNSFLFVRA